MVKSEKIITMLFVLTGLMMLTPLICMAGQKLQIYDPVYRFEGIYAGIPVTHTFKIKNIGDAPLKIEKVTPP
jgi:hypothetical protein